MNIATVAIASMWDFSFLNGKRWNPVRTGSYTVDCATGREAASEVIDLGRAMGNPMLVKTFLQLIAESNDIGAAEIGAFGAIAEALNA